MATATNPFGELTLAERLRISRARSRMSRAAAAAQASDLLPQWIPMSREIVRRLEDGRIADALANVMQLRALAEVYGVDPEWLLPADSDDLVKIRRLVAIGVEKGDLSRSVDVPDRERS